MTNKERTELLREFLCGCAKRGSFSLIIYDAHSGRTCAARTAASPKLFFGFDKKKNGNAATKEEGKRGLCVSTDEKSLENVDLSILPSGRFIYGRQYVKPMEFTQFWSTAPSKQNYLNHACRRFDELSVIKGRKDYKSCQHEEQ